VVCPCPLDCHVEEARKILLAEAGSGGTGRVSLDAARDVRVSGGRRQLERPGSALLRRVVMLRGERRGRNRPVVANLPPAPLEVPYAGYITGPPVLGPYRRG
jgi:hypothetical protein